MYIAFRNYHQLPYPPFFGAMKIILDAVDGRPCGGKMHGLPVNFLGERFGELSDRRDPIGVFTNDYLNRTLGPLPERRVR